MTYILKTGFNEILDGQAFVATAPQLKGEPRIREGDLAYIWFFETPREGASGNGLAARGIVDVVTTVENSNMLRVEIRVTESIRGPRFGIEQLLENTPEFLSLERKIRGYSHKQIRRITPQEASLLSQSFP